MTVTSRPAPASRRAADSPPSPAPTTTTLSVGPMTVRIEAASGSASATRGGVREIAQGVRSGGVDETRLECAMRLVVTLGDECFDPVHRAGCGDDVAQDRDTVLVEGGIAEQPAQCLLLCVVRRLQRERDEDRALAFAKIVARGLAGLGRIA